MLGVTPGSTLDNVRESARPRPVALLRGASIAALVAVLVCGVAGLLGVHSTTAYAKGGGLELELHYARIARAGLDVPWTLTVRRSNGFSAPIVIAVTSHYFDMFETQGWRPEPSAQSQDGDRIYMTFDPPPADTLVIDFDAYIQPSSQKGASGEVAVSEHGADVTAIQFSTWLVP